MVAEIEAGGACLLQGQGWLVAVAGKQLGLRIDRVLYAEFLEVCRREKLGPSEAVEALVRAAVAKQGITSTVLLVSRNDDGQGRVDGLRFPVDAESDGKTPGDEKEGVRVKGLEVYRRTRRRSNDSPIRAGSQDKGQDPTRQVREDC